MKYKIEIHSNGFEDYSKIVDRPSRGAVTKTDVLQAKVEWQNHNDIDADYDSIELPFHRITKV